MDTDKIRTWAQNIVDECGPVAPPPPTVVPISTPDAFERALSAALPGDTLVLASSLDYRAPVTLGPFLTLQAETWLDRQGQLIAADEPAPRLLGGFHGAGDGYKLLGLELGTPDQRDTIAVMGGLSAWLDRVRVLGHIDVGGKRGIDYRGGAGTISLCRVDDIFQPAQDTQALYSQEMLPGGGLAVRDCYFRAAGEVVMFGGGDSSAPETMPSNVSMANVVHDKRPEWTVVLGPGKHAQQIKNGLEFKACRGFRGSNLSFRNCGGITAGQGGYNLVFTPRNQGHTAPWSSVEDIEIDGFTIDGGSGIASFLGFDDTKDVVSGPANKITLRNGIVTNLDRLVFGLDASGNPQATGRIFNFNRGPKNVTLDGIAAAGVNVKAHGYFSGTESPVGLKLSRLVLPPSSYTWKLDGNTHPVGVNWPTGAKAALLAYAPDAQIDDQIVF